MKDSLGFVDQCFVMVERVMQNYGYPPAVVEEKRIVRSAKEACDRELYRLAS